MVEEGRVSRAGRKEARQGHGERCIEAQLYSEWSN